MASTVNAQLGILQKYGYSIKHSCTKPLNRHLPNDFVEIHWSHFAISLDYNNFEFEAFFRHMT